MKIYIGAAFSRYYNNIVPPEELFLIQTVRFPHQACKMMTDNAVAHLLAYGNPQPVSVCPILHHVHHHAAVCP